MKIDIQPPQRKNTLSLADGRKLCWYEWGPVTGYPLLFCTGAGMSGSLGFGFSHLERLNLRLIAPDRPGLGESSIDPNKTLQTWVDDIGELLQHCNIVRYAALGFSQGLPFALSLAKTDKLSVLVAVSGQDQLSHPSVRPFLQPDVLKMIENREKDVKGFENWISVHTSVDWLWNFIMNSSSPVDVAIYSQSAFSQAYRECLEEGFSQGPEGYARDLVIALGGWPVQPEQLNCPVLLYYGQLDNSTVHSPDHGQQLSKRFINAEYYLYSTEGGSLLWARAEEILEKLSILIKTMNPKI